MLTEAEREAIVKSGRVYLANGLRAGLAGIKIEEYCGVHSAEPGFWRCRWEVAAEVVQRPDRRFKVGEVWCSNPGGWFGCLPAPREDWQTEADYLAAIERGDADERADERR
jgi:hypothetical protein